MGSEASDTLPPKSTVLCNQSKSGFHHSNYDDQTTKQPNANRPRSRIISKYDANEFSMHFDQVLLDVNEDLKTIDEESDQSKDKTSAWVPKENIIPDIGTLFSYKKQLGVGASCRVLKALHLKNHKLYAVKELTKQDVINIQLFREEVKILKKVIHPNILHYYDCYIDDACYYIATEYCSGGTMLDKITQMKSFSEQKASEYIRTILSAVHYIHSLNIVHRDLKAQNMVFNTDSSDGVLQLIDFGDSKIVDDHEWYTEFIGTIHYIPPEIVRPRTGSDLKKSDLWSVGVIAFILVCGKPPFTGHSQQQILETIVSKDKVIKYPKSIQLTASCKDFIEGLLCDDIDDRLSASQALKHEWICGGSASTNVLSNDILQSLKRYNYDNKLQNILVNAILTEMEEDEQEILSHGLVSLNKKKSNMHAGSVVNYLLLHSSIHGSPEHNKQWKQRRMTSIQTYQKSTSKQRPDDAEEPTLMRAQRDTDTIPFDWNVDELDVDSKSEEEDGFDGFDSDTLDDILDSLVSSFGDDVLGVNSELTMNVSSSVEKTISVDKFKAIMEKSNKKYDVQAIVNDLKDDNGDIALHKIASYRKRIQTVYAKTMRLPKPPPRRSNQSSDACK